MSVGTGGLCICVCPYVCVIKKNTAVYCPTARKSLQNDSLSLGFAIHILKVMPRKPDSLLSSAMTVVSNSCAADKNITITGCGYLRDLVPITWRELIER